jgi:hypothetical protein
MTVTCIYAGCARIMLPHGTFIVQCYGCCLNVNERHFEHLQWEKVDNISVLQFLLAVVFFAVNML